MIDEARVQILFVNRVFYPFRARIMVMNGAVALFCLQMNSCCLRLYRNARAGVFLLECILLAHWCCMNVGVERNFPPMHSFGVLRARRDGAYLPVNVD
jgi:hypothetical protein